CMQALQTPYSV
nr:immunoglobulin light chain junction region [Macaca mulatta]MPN89652.1 immunoglobulin light chain junction region [Macaca mulatta]